MDVVENAGTVVWAIGVLAGGAVVKVLVVAGAAIVNCSAGWAVAVKSNPPAAEVLGANAPHCG